MVPKVTEGGVNLMQNICEALSLISGKKKGRKEKGKGELEAKRVLELTGDSVAGQGGWDDRGHGVSGHRMMNQSEV